MRKGFVSLTGVFNEPPPGTPPGAPAPTGVAPTTINYYTAPPPAVPVGAPPAATKTAEQIAYEEQVAAARPIEGGYNAKVAQLEARIVRADLISGALAAGYVFDPNLVRGNTAEEIDRSIKAATESRKRTVDQITAQVKAEYEAKLAASQPRQAPPAAPPPPVPTGYAAQPVQPGYPQQQLQQPPVPQFQSPTNAFNGPPAGQAQPGDMSMEEFNYWASTEGMNSGAYAANLPRIEAFKRRIAAGRGGSGAPMPQQGFAPATSSTFAPQAYQQGGLAPQQAPVAPAGVTYQQGPAMQGQAPSQGWQPAAQQQMQPPPGYQLVPIQQQPAYQPPPGYQLVPVQQAPAGYAPPPAGYAPPPQQGPAGAYDPTNAALGQTMAANLAQQGGPVTPEAAMLAAQRSVSRPN